MIRTRFAPSPTGYLHVGGLRTALFNYLMARKEGGRFILRIEDTDRKRRVDEAVQQLIDMLHWAGIDFDEGPGKPGNYGPYIQSERLDIYNEYARQLIGAGNAYYCFCPPDRLEKVREEQIAHKQHPGYDRHCRKIPSDEAQSRIENGEQYVIRMKMPIEGERVFTDLVRGVVRIPYNVLDDQVIIKSDGYPTYHLAVVVDDHLMNITHIIRGEEWLPSTPKHFMLYEYFGWEPPQTAHLPLLLNPDRSKLSKRQRHVAVEDYKAMGILPEALINFVALLGWNPGDDRELFTIEELMREFSTERINKAGAVFDVEKLKWMNGEYLKKYPVDLLAELVKPYLETAGFNVSDTEKLRKVAEIIQPRITLLTEAVAESAFVYGDNIVPHDDEASELVNLDSSKKLFTVIHERLSGLSAVTGDEFKIQVQEIGGELGLKGKLLFMPVRVALTGKAKGPDLPHLVDVLGLPEVIKRIARWR
jgi:nondiscriminating glutamyl-tRNA synthetase